MTKEKADEIILKIIRENNIWDYIDNDKKIVQNAVYLSGVLDMGYAIVRELEREKA